MAEEVGRHCIYEQEAGPVPEVHEDQDEPQGGQGAQVVQVLVVGLCVGRLVLGDRVHEGIAGLGVLHEQAADPGREGAEVALGGEEYEDDQPKPPRHPERPHPLPPGVPPRQAIVHPHVLAVPQDLVSNEHRPGPQLLQRLERGETNHGNLARQGRPHQVEGRVAPVDPGPEPSHQHQDGGVAPDHVEDEDIPPPSGGHVEVGQAGQAPEDRGGPQRSSGP